MAFALLGPAGDYRSGWTGLRGKGHKDIMNMLEDAFSEHAQAQEDMMEWALDWEAADDEYDYDMIEAPDLDDAMDEYGLAMATIIDDVLIRFANKATKSSKRLSLGAKSAFRQQARSMFKQAMKDVGRKLGRNFEIHHRIPLKFAHVLRLDPNDVKNLQKVSKSIHRQITEAWQQFARKSKNPTQQQIRKFADEMDRTFQHEIENLTSIFK
jgi:hypothetical protein